MNKGQFKIQKVSDVGTSNPIVARLSMGLHDIVQMAQIKKEEKDLINLANYNAMHSIVKAEKIGLRVCAAIDAEMAKLDREGVKTQSHDRVVEVPSTEGLDDIREFLKHSKKALQDIIPTFNLFLGTTYANPRYDKLLEVAKKKYGAKDPVVLQLTDDYPWIKQLLDFRNEDEHPTKDYLYKDFDVSWSEEHQKWLVRDPVFYDGSTGVYALIKSTIHNLLTFAEEMSVLFLQKVVPPIVEIRQIPEDKRPKDPERRFTMEIKEGFNRQPRKDTT